MEGLGKIAIKDKNKGSFTKYCKNSGFNGVTKACISKGKASKNPKTRKKATFADNASKWH